MTIVDSKETILIDGLKYQVHSSHRGDLITGCVIELRRVIPTFLKISIGLKQSKFYYSPFSITLSSYFRSRYSSSHWWETPIKIKDLENQFDLINQFKEVKRTSKLFNFLTRNQ